MGRGVMGWPSRSVHEAGHCKESGGEVQVQRGNPADHWAEGQGPSRDAAEALPAWRWL